MLKGMNLTVGSPGGINAYTDGNFCRLLSGKKVIVSAGPTYEYLDPITFLGNRSSGKMGFSLAIAALAAGAEVVLVSGPVSLPDPEGISVHHIVSAEEMQNAVLSEYDDADIVIMAAAVTDFRPADISGLKLKKAEQADGLRLVRTPDILAGLGKNKGNRFLCGFAAESNNVAEYARKKLKEKNIDLILANDVTLPGSGFAVDTNIITAYYDNKEKAFPLLSKQEVACRIIELISEIMG